MDEIRKLNRAVREFKSAGAFEARGAAEYVMDQILVVLLDIEKRLSKVEGSEK